MHRVKIDNNLIRTDLLLEKNPMIKEVERKNYKDIKVVTSKSNNNLYTTIFFNDITDTTSYYNLEKVLVEEFYMIC